VTYGSAGLAYGLLRLPRVREDPELLALADLWSVRAGVHAQQEGAFSNADLEIVPETVGRSSPYHTMSGVLLRPYSASGMNDVAGFKDACDDFVRASQDLCRIPTRRSAERERWSRSLIELGRSMPPVDLFVQVEATGSRRP
jgi:hypothetical protein